MIRVDVTGVDLVKLIQKVYELSKPLGLGHFHYTPEPLTEKEAKAFIYKNAKDGFVVDLDYVKGRACKFHVRKIPQSMFKSRLFIAYPWYDHTDMQFKELLSSVGIVFNPPTTDKDHGISCACKDCEGKI